MQHINPKISVITATWNCVSTIQHCMASVASQSYPHLEHVVVDGQSRDGTLQVLQACRSQIDTLVSEPDKGIYDALNKGLRLATGDVVGFLHADDVYADDQVLADVAAAFSDPSVQAVYGDLVYISNDSENRLLRVWKAGRFRRELLGRGWMPPHPTLYLRRSIYDQVGGFDISYRISADYLSVLQIFSDPGLEVRYIPRVLVRMRAGGASNRSLRNLLVKSTEDLRALRKTGVGGPMTLMIKNLSKLGQFAHRIQRAWRKNPSPPST